MGPQKPPLPVVLMLALLGGVVVAQVTMTRAEPVPIAEVGR